MKILDARQMLLFLGHVQVQVKQMIATLLAALQD